MGWLPDTIKYIGIKIGVVNGKPGLLQTRNERLSFQIRAKIDRYSTAGANAKWRTGFRFVFMIFTTGGSGNGFFLFTGCCIAAGDTGEVQQEATQYGEK